MRSLIPSKRTRSRLTFVGLQGLGVLSLVWAVVGWPRPVLYVLVGILIAYTWYKGRKLTSDAYLGLRVLVIGCILVDAVRHAVAITPWLGITVAILSGLTLIGYGLRVRMRRSSFAVNLPQALTTRTSRLRGGPVFAFTSVLTVLLAVVVLLASTPAGLVVDVVVAGVAVAGSAILLGMTLADHRTRSAAAVAMSIRTGLESQAPKFVLYFSAPKGSAYQVTMWLPYFERAAEPYAIVVRERWAVNALRAVTEVPIVHASTLGALENVIVPSVRTVYYVNNGMKNAHCVRLAHLTHVQLLHGDSDKPPSYSPVTAMYDKVFVAGQAGIDRYAKHGVLIHESKFEIVGRPQVEDIAGPDRAIGAIEAPVVLYAPTWKGQYADSSLSSLPVGVSIVAALLDLGATVIFRPHPYSKKDLESRGCMAEIESMLSRSRSGDGRAHRFGAEASTEMTIVECLNASDAMVSDVSSVAADYLFSGKPFAITDVGLHGGSVTDEYPLIRASYLLPWQDDPRPGLQQMLGPDPKASTRQDLRAHYLGDFPQEGYAQVFLAAVRRLANQPEVEHVEDDEVELERVDTEDRSAELAESDSD